MDNGSNWWWKGNAELAEYCRSRFPEETAEVLDRAGRVYKNTFLFTEKWEMEQTNEPVVFPGQVEWTRTPSGDPEWIFALNRHTCLLQLGQAYLLTRENCWLEKFQELILDWIARVPLTDESTQTAWRTLDSGLRCENWLKAIVCFDGGEALTQECRQQMQASLRTHGEYLYSTDDDFRVLSNWGVLQNHGLFLLGVYFSEQRYCERALERLARELRIQVLPDGVHWEQSPMYHCEVLRCYLDSITIARRNAVALPEDMEETVRRMTLALADLCKPDGCLPCQSDSDCIDARDLLVHGAYLFQDGVLKSWAGDGLYFENVWSVGPQAQAGYDALKAVPPAGASRAMPESGNYILRGGVDKNAQYLRFRCGCLGSGHGHADLLHVDLYAHGEDILLDAGRYTYVDGPVRRELKQPAAHNTLRVDGKNFSVCKDSWGYAKLAMPVKGEYRFGKSADFVSGGHLGYADLPGGPVYVCRKIVFVRPNVTVICDEFYGRGSHVVEQSFHFPRAVSCPPGGVDFQGSKAKAKFLFLTPGVHTAQTGSSWSCHYNALEKGSCVRNTKKAEGFISLLTVIATAQGDEKLDLFAEELPVFVTSDARRLTADQAQAVRIVCQGKECTVLFCHQEVISEVGLLQAGAYKGYGKTVVFTKGYPDGECLQW